MANEVISGKEGALTYTPSDGSATVLDVTQFIITIKGGIIDTTDSSSGWWRDKIEGKFKDWSGSLDLFLKAGMSAIPINTVCSASFTIETTNATITKTGNIIITEVGETVPIEAEEAVKLSVTFEGAGTLTSINT